MTKTFLYADFNNADAQGRLRLNVRGTLDDLAGQGIQLEESMPIVVYDVELEADGSAQFSKEEQIWVAVIDWRVVRQKHA
ncbi:MAG TPA: hypothetical protein VMP01_05865 [Pirellulaceae bacterium]|nr:hypothetical protein [Pirellulaceae bacterium]